jgi:ABC-type multidrug transport system fused ATPase/permease subunit
MPAFSILLGRTLNTIGDPGSGGLAALDKAATWLLYLGAASGLAAYADAAAWGCAGVRAGRAARVRFLEAALAKPMAFHDGVLAVTAPVAAKPAVTGGGEEGDGKKKKGVVVAVTAATAAGAPAAPAAAPAAATPATAVSVSVRLMRALEDDAEAVSKAVASEMGPFICKVAKVVSGLVVGASFFFFLDGMVGCFFFHPPKTHAHPLTTTLSLLARLGCHSGPPGHLAHHRRCVCACGCSGGEVVVGWGGGAQAPLHPSLKTSPPSLLSPPPFSVCNALLGRRIQAMATARSAAAAGYASLATEALAGVRTLYALNLQAPTKARFGRVS